MPEKENLNFDAELLEKISQKRDKYPGLGLHTS